MQKFSLTNVQSFEDISIFFKLFSPPSCHFYMAQLCYRLLKYFTLQSDKCCNCFSSQAFFQFHGDVTTVLHCRLRRWTGLRPCSSLGRAPFFGRGGAGSNPVTVILFEKRQKDLKAQNGLIFSLQERSVGRKNCLQVSPILAIDYEHTCSKTSQWLKMLHQPKISDIIYKPTMSVPSVETVLLFRLSCPAV